MQRNKNRPTTAATTYTIKPLRTAHAAANALITLPLRLVGEGVGEGRPGVACARRAALMN